MPVKTHWTGVSSTRSHASQSSNHGTPPNRIICLRLPNNMLCMFSMCTSSRPCHQSRTAKHIKRIFITGPLMLLKAQVPNELGVTPLRLTNVVLCVASERKQTNLPDIRHCGASERIYVERKLEREISWRHVPQRFDRKYDNMWCTIFREHILHGIVIKRDASVRGEFDLCSMTVGHASGATVK